MEGQHDDSSWIEFLSGQLILSNIVGQEMSVMCYGDIRNKLNVSISINGTELWYSEYLQWMANWMSFRSCVS